MYLDAYLLTLPREWVRCRRTLIAIACLVACITITPTPSYAQNLSVEQHIAKAQQEDKLLLFFLLRDDPASQALSRGALSRNSSVRRDHRFEVVGLYFPRTTKGLTEEVIEKLDRFSRDFNVDYLPMLVLADAQARPVVAISGLTGNESSEDIEKAIHAIIYRGHNFKRVMAGVEKCQGRNKSDTLHMALTQVDAQFHEYYRPQIEEIIKLDSTRDGVPRNHWQPIINGFYAHDELRDVRAVANELGDKAAAIPQLDAIVTKYNLQTGHPLQELLFYKAQLLNELGRHGEANQTMTAAIAADPNSKFAQHQAQQKQGQ